MVFSCVQPMVYSGLSTLISIHPIRVLIYQYIRLAVSGMTLLRHCITQWHDITIQCTTGDSHWLNARSNLARVELCPRSAFSQDAASHEKWYALRLCTDLLRFLEQMSRQFAYQFASFIREIPQVRIWPGKPRPRPKVGPGGPVPGAVRTRNARHQGYTRPKRWAIIWEYWIADSTSCWYNTGRV